MGGSVSANHICLILTYWKNEKERGFSLIGKVEQVLEPLDATSVDIIFASLTSFIFPLTIKVILLHLGCIPLIKNSKTTFFSMDSR